MTRKIAIACARIAAGLQDHLYLGNLDAVRDWGYAKEYVEAMWLMLQHDFSDDYVVATGTTHTVRELVECAFGVVNLPWQEHVKYSEDLTRPAEPTLLVGSPEKIGKVLGWRPKTEFKELVREMVEAELQALDGKGRK